ncbi:dihydrofolate reductase [Patescibacteria group bacterium]|nr:dihydrofolate reductase [Patescibacteria group bacterium]
MNNLVIAIIVAVAQGNLIGRAGKIPWIGGLPIDMKYFKELTTNHVVIMGRRTWESLPGKYRPLPNRLNIVLSSTMPESEEYVVARNLEEAIELAFEAGHSQIFIIGGGQVYKTALEVGIVDEIYLTQVLAEFGPNQTEDVFFQIPEGWQLINSQNNPQDSQNKYPCKFEKWVRR